MRATLTVRRYLNLAAVVAQERNAPRDAVDDAGRHFTFDDFFVEVRGTEMDSAYGADATIGSTLGHGDLAAEPAPHVGVIVERGEDELG